MGGLLVKEINSPKHTTSTGMTRYIHDPLTSTSTSSMKYKYYMNRVLLTLEYHL
jgi:hypothetical protein